MKKISLTKKKRLLRKKRVRAKILREESIRPRLSVFKSNKHIYLQIIDDNMGNTLVSAHDQEIKDRKNKKRLLIGKELGKLIAEKGKKKKIKKIVFDRGRYAYHGIVRAIAEGAREGGLEF